MSESVSTNAAVEYRHERADDAFRRYVEQLQLAQKTHDAAGSP